MSFLSPEEKEFIRGLYSTAGDCSECGKQISSARQIEEPGTDLCSKCAAVVNKGQIS
jgi:RNA polymerase-binding transcription factor DksA